MSDVHDFVDTLSAAGAYPAALGSLFNDVPRGAFIPDRMWYRDENWNPVPVDRAEAPEEWAAAVYFDGPIITQWDDGKAVWPEIGDIPTCSASQPSLVAAMLAALEVQPGDAVLEIGTGTGLNAAYLARLAGDDGRVSTVEIDEAVLTLARASLGRMGFSDVTTLLGDGACGDPECAPFDRVISTMGVYAGRVPYAWVEQTRPGGVIVAPVRADLASGPLVRFTVAEDGTASGQIEPMSAGFMVSRLQRGTSTDDGDPRWHTEAEVLTHTDIDPTDVFRNPAARFAVAMAVPNCRYGGEWWLRDPLTGSWATVDGDGKVRQAGPRRLWTEVTAAWSWWKDRGCPPLDGWRWVITPTEQYVTL